MQAVIYEGPRRIRVGCKPDPRIEHPNDAILRVTRAGISGADVHLMRGEIPDTRVGTTFGHELTGVVEEVGPSVRGLQRGDRVVVPFNIACGSCFFCQRELFGSCEQTNPGSESVAGALGWGHLAGGYDGAQAEYVRIPFADVGPMRIPDALDDDEVLFLGRALPSGYQAAEMTELRTGDTVVVFGCGPEGLFAQAACWMMGAGRVIAVDRIPARLAFAKVYTGVEVVDFERVKDPVAHLRDLSGGRGPDACIIATSDEAGALSPAIDSVRKGGRVSIVGGHRARWGTGEMATAVNKGLTFRMSPVNARRYMPRLMKLISEGELEPKRAITHRFPLAKAGQAYALLDRPDSAALGCVLLPAASA